LRKPLFAALIAVSILPISTLAQSAGEVRRSQQDVREDQRDLRDARRDGDKKEVRDAKEELRDSRAELREDRRDYDRNEWRKYRESNSNIYNAGNWRSGYRYRTFNSGVRINSGYYAPRYVINDPWIYRLPRPTRTQRWVRHYNDVLLVDTRRGLILQVNRSFFR
jgi:Ni/Co efflux regulator RcnB